MANTLNLGDGNWATKEDLLLGYNSENNNYKPLPFDFSRASFATRVNKDGLIETVGGGQARIDFKDDSKGALLLEPSRSNDLQRSQEFDNAYWTKYQTSVSANSSISPDGTLNADKLIEDNSNSTHQIGRAISYNSGTTYVVSVFAKSSDRNLEISAGNTNTFPAKAIFDLSNGTVLSSTLGNASIEKFNNEWYRCIITATALATSNTNINFGLANGSTLSYIGNGVSFVELFGAMREQGSYATSYIPTQGSAVTRLQDDFSCNLPDTDSFNSSTGFSVITKFGIGEANGSTSVPFLQFNDDTSNTYIGFGSDQNNFRCRLTLNGISYLNTQDAPRTQENNLFVSCDSNGWSQGANGSVNDTGTTPASIFDRLSNITINVTEVYGIIKIKEILIYNTRLSNAELQELTTI